MCLDIIWYHDDKIVRNTERVKIRIEDNRTLCTIKDVTIEDVGTYVCKAQSDIGLAVTKAKLNVQEITEEQKQDIRLKKAQQKVEKIKKEKVRVEKSRELRRRQRGSLTSEEIKPLDVKEVVAVEQAEEIKEQPKPKDKAVPIIPVLQPVSTEATAACKKIDDTEETTEEFSQTAKTIISTKESLSVSEIHTDTDLGEVDKHKPKSRTAKTKTSESVSEEVVVTEVNLEEVIKRVEEIIINEEIRMAKEVSEVLDFIRVKEFGPGENPLRELAEIGYLVRNGITVKEVTVLYNEDKFPYLKTPESQSAMVNVVERKGYGPLISEVLTEETTVDEKVMAATVGFRAFMKMVELKYATVEEVITLFKPDDFITHAWEITEVLEVLSTQ